MDKKIEVYENIGCGWYIARITGYLHKDFMWHGSTGYSNGGYKYGEAPGYYPTKAIAQAYLGEYLRRVIVEQMKANKQMLQYREEQKMITLSNGVKLSEDTIVSALKSAGINVEPPKPKYVFKSGDTAINRDGGRRIIVGYSDDLKSFNLKGMPMSKGQQEFEEWGYKYVDKLKDMVINN